MYVAFKNRSLQPTLYNWVITQWTGSELIHTELIVGQAPMYAVSARLHPPGVQALPARDVIDTRSGGWEVYWVPVRSEQQVFDFCLAQIGMSFNFAGILTTHGFGIPRSTPGQWFCSELAFVVLSEFSDLLLPAMDAAEVSPSLLRKMLLDAGLKPIPDLRF